MASKYPNDASAFVPRTRSLPKLRAASRGCAGCHLCELGTQTVFGEGPARAELMLVGEQPGDQEDRAGRPFVGPAGRVLDRALASAGIERKSVYLTNAVKHFKWKEGQGKRRLHAKPNGTEVHACAPWLVAEVTLVQPRVLVLLGATAAQGVFGSLFRVTEHRGEVLRSPLCDVTVATLHPSAVLRAPDSAARAAQLAMLVQDLHRAALLARRRRGAAADNTARI